jgi:hypothetical protein
MLMCVIVVGWFSDRELLCCEVFFYVCCCVPIAAPVLKLEIFGRESRGVYMSTLRLEGSSLRRVVLQIQLCLTR